MFSIAKQRAFSAIGASLLTAILLFTPVVVLVLLSSVSPLLGVALFIPGIVLIVLAALLFVFIIQAVAIDNLSAADAIGKSIDTAKKNYFGVLLLSVIFIIASILLRLIPVLGFFVNALLVSPLWSLALTALYMEKRGEKKPARKPAKKPL